MRQTQAILGIDSINSFGESQMSGLDLVQHHVKYKEIHGEDVIVLMTRSEHKKLHNRLRREGKCNIPAIKLHTISNKAHKRTLSNKIKQREYESKSRIRMTFTENVGKNVSLYEIIDYNIHTNNFCYVSGFKTFHGLKLLQKRIL